MDEIELQARLKSLTEAQLRFVSARLHVSTDAEAARNADVGVKTPANWDNKPLIDEIVVAAKIDGINVAREQLRRLASRAVAVIGDELEARRGSPRRLDAALAALDRIGLTAKTAVEITGNVHVSHWLAELRRVDGIGDGDATGLVIDAESAVLADEPGGTIIVPSADDDELVAAAGKGRR